MSEKITIIASILGIIGAIWGVIKFIFKPYFQKKEEFKRITNLVDESYERWIQFGYTIRGGSMVSHDNFLIVNKYRSKFRNKQPKKKAYLLKNAIQNGLGGYWGLWLDMNKDNKLILLHLFLALDKSNGLRPAWRSAYILEKIYFNKNEEIDKFIDESEIVLNSNQEYLLNIIKTNSVEEKLQDLLKNGTKEEKEKLNFVNQEIMKFQKQINDFTENQTIVR